MRRSLPLPSCQYQSSGTPAAWAYLMRQFCSCLVLRSTSQPPYSWHSPLASSQVIFTSEKRYLWPASQLRFCHSGVETQNTREIRLLTTRIVNILEYLTDSNWLHDKFI